VSDTWLSYFNCYIFPVTGVTGTWLLIPEFSLSGVDISEQLFRIRLLKGICLFVAAGICLR